ncbi:sensor histidine kinase [Herbivorax sp. ANBcel31]|uniref:sensor histidine kinase n=1 Tax=Herbivorax sp. ANBcel31 TaxID=3069754 RepID=UPI0027B8413F|nr:sensor histidine kinase [Herbivorax sp. ANBcel31]MDQ2084871.1 sensor histidine kinase [Herbivorax sp. ANBcel31]
MRLRLQILNKINDIPINTKFILISIFCVIIPILSVNLIFLNSLSNTVREREEENFKISYERAKTDIAHVIREGLAVSHSIYYDRGIYDELDKSYEKGEYYSVFTDSLKGRVDRYLAIYRNISNITIYTSNDTIDSGGYFIILNDEIKDTPWYKKNKEFNGNPMLYADIETIDYSKNRYDEFLSIIRVMDQIDRAQADRPQTMQHERILKVDINTHWIYNALEREKDYLSLYIVDDEGRVVLAVDDYVYGNEEKYEFIKFDDLGFNESEILFDGNLWEASYIKDWRLVGVPNEEKVYMAMKQARHFILLLACVSILISGFLVWIILRSYNDRIKKLSSHMSKFGDEQLDLIVLNEGKDEIGQLIRKFNKMAVKINTLINDVYKLQIQKKDLELERVQAEINFLQSQMNPHFLFNTLNAMLIVSVKNNYTEIIDVIKNLSKTLRRLLSWKDDLVTVEEEICFTEMYLKIEKFRFSEKFKYNVFIDEGVHNFKIPKMSIQPLVENACKHGIQSIKGHGDITVEIRVLGEDLKVSVKDNGIGILEDQIEDILMSLEDDIYKAGSIGIRNVYRRLKLYYGEDLKFFIESKKGKGTTVSFLIPFTSKLSNQKSI